MRLLRSIGFVLIFYPLTVLAVIAALIAEMFGDRALRFHVRAWAHIHRWCTYGLLGVDARIEGTIPRGPHLFAAKHQSMFETLDLLLLLEDPAVVIKRELADIPLFGRAARHYGVIPVDREGSAKELRRMLRAAAVARDTHRRVLIFPEGTRVHPGETPPVRPGFAGLYRQLGLPVVPIALDSGLFLSRKGLSLRTGTITMRFGEPIPPGLPRAEIEERVHAAINALEG